MHLISHGNNVRFHWDWLKYCESFKHITGSISNCELASHAGRWQRLVLILGLCEERPSHQTITPLTWGLVLDLSKPQVSYLLNRDVIVRDLLGL